jgi:hypothetical protein
VEWAFPLRGRWLRYFLTATLFAGFFALFSFWIVLSEWLFHLLTATQVHGSYTGGWHFAEHRTGNWSTLGIAPFRLELGPLGFTYLWGRLAGRPNRIAVAALGWITFLAPVLFGR